jgi:hypothetical protein
MKTKNLFTHLGVASREGSVLLVLIAVLNLILAGGVTGQTFTTLHSFTATSGSGPYTNSDGAKPEAGLILSGNTLYGTAWVRLTTPMLHPQRFYQLGKQQ